MEKDYGKMQDAIEKSDKLNNTLEQNRGSVGMPDFEDIENVNRPNPSNNELNDMEQGGEFIENKP